MSVGPWWALALAVMVVAVAFGVSWLIVRGTPHEWVEQVEAERRQLDGLGKAVNR